MFKEKYYYIHILLVLAVLIILSKILKHPPNFTPLISIIVLSSFLIKKKSILIATIILSLLIADSFLGFYPGISLVYLNFIFITLTTKIIFKNLNFINLFLMGFYSSFIFFLLSTPIHFFFQEYAVMKFENLLNLYKDGYLFFVNTLFSTIIFNYIIGSIIIVTNFERKYKKN